MSAKLAMEFIGTFFLCLTVGLSAALSPNLAPVAIGGVLMCFVYAGSGGGGADWVSH
jgi:aquaporin Z